MKKSYFPMVLALLWSAGGTYAAPSSTPSNGFLPATSLTAGTSPRGVAVGNVFGNGTQSLVVANFGSPTFIGQSTPASILGAGNSNLEIFSPSPSGLQLVETIPSAASPRGVALFDRSGSGRQDIFATAYDAGLLQVFSWTGGRFAKADEAPTLNMPVGVAVGLTRAGGAAFAAVADFGSNMVSIFPLRDGRLGKRTDIAVDGGPTQLAIGDLSGNGSNEIAVVCLPSNKIDILSLTSANEDNPASYAMAQTLSLPPGGAPSDLRIADLDNSGKQDLVVADFSKNAVFLFTGRKGGALSLLPPLSTSGSHPNGLTVADLYGDGQKEIIVANRDSDSIDLFQPSFGGQYQLSQTLRTSDEINGSFGPVEVAALDATGSGKMDLVASHMRSNTVKVLTQPADTAASPSPTVSTNGGSFSVRTTYCYPNPSRDGHVTFSFALETPSAVSIQVFDVQGERVWGRTISAGQTQSGINTFAWDGTNQTGQSLASGLYLYNLTVGNRTVTKKLAIIH